MMFVTVAMVCVLRLGTVQSTDWDLYSDTWVAADALGREVLGADVCGPPRPDRYVGMFYWTWHTMQGNQGPYDNTRILAADPNNPQWGPLGAPHHWGEPELGYYISTDPYVIRKHASMLADAGVDVVIFDTTNPPFTFKESYMVLCAEYRKMREQGNRTPQIAFLAPFGDPTVVVQAVYEDLYSQGLYEELWFRWDGKPLIMADPAYFKDSAIQSFFTFRKPIPSYFTGPSGPDQWGWLEVYPQHVFRDKEGNVEQVAVGIAQNAVGPDLSAMSHKDGARGRSWHDGAKDPDANAVHFGYNVVEQWTRALELDPEFIFITGWNEWVAGRFDKWYKYTGKDSYYPDALFVDEYDHEYSRDIEPMKGGHTDSYYYQMVSYIRRFKGVRQPAKPGPRTSVAIDGDFADWSDVKPEYRDTIGDTTHRDHKGYGGTHYTDASGRNDIVLCKMTRDSENLYCYVRTAEPMTPCTDPNWMLLFLDVDLDPETGWQGYDALINAEVLDSDTTTVKRTADGRNWQTVAQVPYRVRGNELELQAPLSAIGYKPDSRCTLDFHWADNIRRDGNTLDFAGGGDHAPNRRFNYRWRSP
ncbi:MAG: hypothetical protein KBE65_04650 [Phycisphaerae bacterium]|nr:hypothetical protein [Phycisphaerae bacterium]